MNDQILPGPVETARIMEFLPHRYPFLLIDRVLSLEMEPERRLTALKNVTINEPFFQGHFPTNPVMPGVLMIEAMAQASGMLAVSCSTWSKSTGPSSIELSCRETRCCWM